MPIPSPQFSEDLAPSLKIIPLQNKTLAPLMFRSLAHYIDILLVLGVSLQCAEFLALTLLKFHLGGISGTGDSSVELFWQVFEMANTWVFAASFFVASIIYFVGCSFWMGRTIGQGLFGLKLEAESGTRPTVLQCLSRTFYCFLSTCTFGFLFLLTREKEKPVLLQDRLSNTFLVSL